MIFLKDKVFIPILIFTTILLILAYYFFNCSPFRETTSNLLLEIIGSLMLGLVVVVFSVLYEDTFNQQKIEASLNKSHNLFHNLVKNSFRRGDSNWNFKNLGPSFYFDKSIINGLSNLLTDENRRWESFLIEYTHVFSKKSELMNQFKQFYEEINSALIIAEKIDKKIYDEAITPELAAGKLSVYPADRLDATERATIKFLVWRGYIAGADQTEILFGIAVNTSFQLQNLDITNIDRIFEQVKVETSNLDNLVDLINELNSKKRKLQIILKKIHKSI